MELLSITEAAKELKCSRQTIFNYIAGGLLQRIKPKGKTFVAKNEIEKLKLPNK